MGALLDLDPLGELMGGRNRGGGEVPNSAPTGGVLRSGDARSDADADTLGFDVVAGPAGAGTWNGAAVWVSTNGGSSWSKAGVLRMASAFGAADTALPTGVSTAAYEQTQTLDVTLASGTLAPATDDELLAGANLAVVGQELFQFGTTTLLGTNPTRYRLSRLLRGRRGTDGHWSTHTAGESFAMIAAPAGIRFLLSEASRGQSVLVRLVGFGDSFGAAADRFLPIPGEEQTPYAPCQIAATRAGNNDLTITWIPRARKNGEWQDGADPAVPDLPERYDVEIYSGVMLKRTFSAVAARSQLYTSAQQTADFGALPDQVTARVYEIGAYGRGYGASAPVPPATVVIPPVVAADGTGGYLLTRPDYVAHVNASGLLSSWSVRGVEVIGALPPRLVGGPGWVFDHFTTAADSVTAYGVDVTGQWMTMIYRARPDGLTITFRHHQPGLMEFHWAFSAGTLGVELLNDKGANRAADAASFVLSGEVRGVPAFRTNRNTVIRLHYPGFELDFDLQVWGYSFNFEGVGIVENLTWRRDQVSPSLDHPLKFTIRETDDPATLPAVKFAPRTPYACALYYLTDPVTWSVDLGLRASYQYLIDAGITQLDCDWEVWNVHDESVATGSASIPLSVGTGTAVNVTVSVPGTGYHSVLFTLTEPSGQMKRSGFRTRFTVIHETTGLYNRDEALAPGTADDYGVIGMLGVAAVRESHSTTEVFLTTDPGNPTTYPPIPGAAPSLWLNKPATDLIFNRGAAGAARYGLTWFFQLNTLPALTASQIRAGVGALLTRYGAQCPVWEVENEPSFIVSAPDYANNLFAPFALGVQDSGASVTVMGPGCVEVDGTGFYLEALYTAGQGANVGAVSTHTYFALFESWEQSGTALYLDDLRAIMAAHGDSGKPLWQTEQGYDFSAVPRTHAARYTVRMFLNGWRKTILPRHNYYFYPVWNGFISWYLAGGGEEGAKDSWLPHASALRFLAENTVGMSYLGDIASPHRGILLSRFSDSTNDTIAAWTWDFDFELTFDCPALTGVNDWMGKPVTPGSAGGHLLLPLSGEPFYLHLPAGASFTVVSPDFGTNYATLAESAIALASSEEEPASFAIDELSDRFRTRTSFSTTQSVPTTLDPHWIEINLPTERTLNQIVIIAASAIETRPRNWHFQADVDGTWQTVAQGTDEERWVIAASFAPVLTRRVRLMITRLSDGVTQDDRWTYLITEDFHYATDMKTHLIALEVYGT